MHIVCPAAARPSSMRIEPVLDGLDRPGANVVITCDRQRLRSPTEIERAR